MFDTVTLACGLTVILRPDRKDEQFSFCLAVPAGARTDPAGRSGLAHLLEHCYALGSSTLGLREIELFVEREGGVRGALTTPDVTLHFSTLPRAAFAATLRAEADRFATLSLPETEVAAERDVVLHEGAERIGRSAGGALVHRLLALAFERHPYRNPVVGWPDEVRALRLADVRSYYEAHYRPANATVALTGGFDPAEALEAIERSIGGGDFRPRPVTVVAAEAEQKIARSNSMAHPKAETPRLAALWKVPPLDHRDTSALLLLEAILQSEAPAARFRHWLLRDRAPFTFYLEGADPGELERRTESVFAAIAAIAGGGARRDSLDRAIRAATNRSRLTDSMSAARTLARFGATSRTGAAWLSGLAARIAAVTEADIARVAARYLRREQSTMVWMTPA